MSETIDQMELKAYKMLSSIYSSMFHQVKSRAMNAVEYSKDKPDDVFKIMENIANPEKWDYCGLISKEQLAILETLEYLLNDKQGEIQKYNEWKPLER